MSSQPQRMDESSTVAGGSGSGGASGAVPMSNGSGASAAMAVDTTSAPNPPATAGLTITATATPPTTATAADGTGAAAAAASANTTAAAAAQPTPGPIHTGGESKFPVSHGHNSQQGMRPTMEDEVIAYDQIVLNASGGAKLNGITSPISFYGVFDGHGGKKAAEYTKVWLVRNLIAALEAGLEPAQALNQAFVKTDADFTAVSGTDTSGTTAVTLLLEQSTKKIWCANAGDSRCILARKGTARPLSMDHKADRPDELDRIRKAGGFVIHKRVMGELAISRAIGDKDFKAADFKLVIADPEIVSDTVVEGDEFIVLACDGLYDVMSNEQIVQWFSDQLKIQAKLASGSTSPTAAAAAVTTIAVAAASTGAGTGTGTGTGGATASTATAPLTPLDSLCTKVVTRAIEELRTRDNVSVIIVKWPKGTPLPPAPASSATATATATAAAPAPTATATAAAPPPPAAGST